MKKKFYSKLFIISLALMCGVVNLFSQPVVTIEPATEASGIFTVPVTVTGFTNVANISLVLNYDETRLVYTGVTANSAFGGTDLVMTPTTDQTGEFRFSFIQGSAITLLDPVNTLFTLTFQAQPGIGGVTVPLTWSSLQGANEFATPPPSILAIPGSTYLAGAINLPAVQVITGPALVCNGSSGNVYNAPTGMNNYVWTVTGGGFITAGDGTDHITVTWTSAGVWSIIVSYDVPSDGSVTSAPYEVIVGPTITGPQIDGLPAKLTSGNTLGQVYTTEPGMTNYVWAVSSAGTGTFTGQGTNEITVDWIDVTSQQSVSVNYTGPGGCTPSEPTVLIINYYPFADAIDPGVIPKYMDPLPHFAAGLRVNAKAGGALVVKAALTQQIALSTGTPVTGGNIDPLVPTRGLGNYAGYAISTDGGANFGPTMWPAQTIETQQGHGVTVEYRNELVGVHYDQFNILADQTLMMNGYTLTGEPLTDPYTGPIPMVVHLHGGEMPSGSDGGPNAWFMPTGTSGVNLYGPTYQTHQSGISTYPNEQEATTLWFHPHDDGLTRINVYTGLAGYYFLRGADEETAKFPGWSGDDKVVEVTPPGKSPTFVGPPTPFFPTPTAYLPEVEIAIQDRMFNVDGELFWPVDPPNPEIHPFWTPEFVGNIMTVNGKTWPYLSVAPRKYRFRMLEGCNARFLNMWLEDASNGAPGPVITVIGGEGGLLAHPVVLDPASSQTLLMAPGQRYDVIVDFTGMENKTFTLMNDAGAPYPDGDPVDANTSQIMQFIVNAQMVEVNSVPGLDNSMVPNDLRPVTPLRALTDFAGNLSAGVIPVVERQIVLNEVSADGGPAAVLVNNSYFDAALAITGDPYAFEGGPTELLREGTTETFSIINISADAHPIHIHLLQWQLVSRQALTVDGPGGYMAAYQAAFTGYNPADFPSGLGYPGGAGTPLPYMTENGDGAIGGNPAVSGFLTGPVLPANPEERGWKDNIIVMPGEVTTFVVRVAPTDRAIDATPQELMFPFDPSDGPGYVWHCHIVDHEDMSMMRPLMITPSSVRFPQITTQPADVTGCIGDASAVSFSVSATSASTIAYQWEVSTDNGVNWTPLTDDAVYTGATTATL
ncbi:MAG: cohesin domain-containing protein, partial [Bacteroidales bacterium]